jgi:hypothetical protein
MKIRQEWHAIASSLLFIALAAYVIQVSASLPSLGGMMPSFAAGGIALFSAIRIVEALRGLRKPLREGEDRFVSVSPASLRPMGMLALSLAYVGLIFVTGFFSASLIFLVAASLFLGVRNWLAIALTAAILIPAMYAFFILFLNARLPAGLLI